MKYARDKFLVYSMMILVFFILFIITWAVQKPLSGSVLTLVLFSSLSAALGTVAFLVVILDRLPQVSVKMQHAPVSVNTLIGIGYAVSILIVLFVPHTESQIFIHWNKLGFLKFARILAALLLVNFLPGYVLLRITEATTKWPFDLPHLAYVIFSFFFSVLVSILVYFVTLVNSTIIPFNAFLSLNIGLCAVYLTYLYKGRHDSKKQTNKIEKKISLKKVLIFFLVLLTYIFSLSATVLLNSNHFPLRSGDQWTLLSNVQEIRNNGLNELTTGKLYWRYLYFAAFFDTSGLPTINAFLSLLPLLPLQYIVLHLLTSYISRCLPKQKGLSLSAFFFLFSGFGWLIFVRSMFSGLNPVVAYRAMTVVSLDRQIRLFPLFFFLLWAFGIPAFLTLIYLTINKDLDSRVRSLLVAVVTVIGMMTHPTEIIIFVTFFVLYIIIARQVRDLSENARLKSIVIGTTAGLLSLIVMDLMAPYRYVLDPTSDIFFSTIVGIFTPTLTWWVGTYVAKVLSKNPIRKYSNLGSYFQLAIALGAAYLYIISILSVLTGQVNSDVSRMELFQYPIVIGILGLLLIFGLVKFGREMWQNDTLRPILLLIPTYVVTIILYRFGTESGLLIKASGKIAESRFLFLLAIPASILGSIIFGKIIGTISSQRHTKVVFSGALICLVIVGGLSSTLLQIQYFTFNENPNISEHDVKAIEYLANNLESNESILTVTDFPSNRLIELSGYREHTLGPSGSWQEFFHEKRPEIVLDLFSEYKIRYIFLRKKDITTISAGEGFLLPFIQKVLRPVVADQNTMLWKIPPLKASQNKGIVFAVPNEERSFYTLPLLVLSASNINYSIRGLIELDIGYDANIIVLPDDPIENNLLYDANQSGFWRPEHMGSGKGNISISFAGLNEEEIYRVEVNEGRYSTWRLVHKFESQEDWSKYDSLNISWRGNNTGAKLAIVVYTGVGNDTGTFLSYFSDTKDGWTDLKKPLKDFRAINGLPDWSAVKRIDVRMYTHNITGKWDISSINMASSRLELTKEKEKQVMDWVQKGGHLIVFNSNGDGLFAKQLKIQNLGRNNTVNGIHGQNTISLSEFNIFEIKFPSDFIILSHFVYKGEVIAPFIGRMRIGDGMITYIHSVPLFDSLSSIDPQLLIQLFRVVALDADLFSISEDQ